MNEEAIRDRLVAHGRSYFNSPKPINVFTKVQEADALLKDLTNHPHAFVLACVMDRRMKADKAWQIPYQISLRLGGFSITQLSKLALEDVVV